MGVIVANVTQQYLQSAMPGKGVLSYDTGYQRGNIKMRAVEPPPKGAEERLSMVEKMHCIPSVSIISDLPGFCNRKL